MNIFVVEDRFALPIHEDVPQGLGSLSAHECGACHQEIYGEWAESMHAKAWTDPYYQVDFLFDGSQQICLNCHIPFQNQQENLILGFRDKERFQPILRPNPDFDASFRDEGVTCAVCHVKNGRILGPYESKNAPHPVIQDSGMIAGTKTCLRCHVVSGKRWDTFFKIPPCGTVAEIEETGREVDCVGCHMPEIVRPIASGRTPRKGRKHLFRGGHHPETVANALSVAWERKTRNGRLRFTFELTNTGAAHYLPTGTPDRHLTMEFRLLGATGRVVDEKIFKMKRTILWRPFILDLYDTRLPFGVPRSFTFEPDANAVHTASVLDVTVRYHLLDEKRRIKIGYENTEPIAYPIFHETIPLE